MTTAETYVAATRHSQEAFMQLWADGVQKFWGLVPTSDAKEPGAPSAEEVLDNAFDCAERVLATQREYVKSWLAANKSIASSTAWLAQCTAQNAAQDMNSNKS